jgi:ABC-2 type transport system ATP-binding protein
MEPSAIADASSRALADVGLTDHADEKIRSFSKGMQQRFGIACALLSAPELLFLDEPTSALDPLGRADVRRLLLELRERGTTVFLNSHLLGEVEQVCDEVAVIDHGRMVESGSLAELLSGPCEVQITLAEPFTCAAEAAAAVGGSLLVVEALRLVVGLPAEESVPSLVDSLVARGARIRAVTRRTRTLESLFLEVTGEGHHG